MGCDGEMWGLSQAPLPTCSVAVGAAVLLSLCLSGSSMLGGSSPSQVEPVAKTFSGGGGSESRGRDVPMVMGRGAALLSVPPPQASPRKHRAGLMRKRGEPSSCVGSGLRWPAPASRWPPARLPAPNEQVPLSWVAATAATVPVHSRELPADS